MSQGRRSRFACGRFTSLVQRKCLLREPANLPSVFGRLSAGCNKRTNARNRQGANSRQQPDRAAGDSPVAAPVVAPSGAFVALKRPMSRVPPVSGMSTEISGAAKPSACSCSTSRSAWPCVVATPNTDIMIFFRLCEVVLLVRSFHVELIVDPGAASC
jgi:hypothetical protein